MLFIIASNNPNAVRNNQESWAPADTQQFDIVDELVQKLENESLEANWFTWSWVDIVSDIDLDIEEKSESQWFFSRLFNRNNNDESRSDNNSLSNQSDNNSPSNDYWQEIAWEDSKQNENFDAPWDNQDTVSSLSVGLYNPIESSNHGNLVKWSLTSLVMWISSTQESKNILHKQDEDFTLWSRFRVATHSLKLNNVYFTETLWYLMQWDELVQLSQKNNFACFLVEVVKSDTAEWKQGYVCEKYLDEVTEELQDSQAQETWDDLTLRDDVQIWDIIELTQLQYDIDDKALFSWDYIEVLSPLSSSWCFTWRVHLVQSWWYKELLWYVGDFCLDDILR